MATDILLKERIRYAMLIAEFKYRRLCINPLSDGHTVNVADRFRKDIHIWNEKIWNAQF